MAQKYSIELKRITYLKFKLDIQKCTWIRGEYDNFHKKDSISSGFNDINGENKERIDISIDENTTDKDRECALKIYPVSEQGYRNLSHILKPLILNIKQNKNNTENSLTVSE